MQSGPMLIQVPLKPPEQSASTAARVACCAAPCMHARVRPLHCLAADEEGAPGCVARFMFLFPALVLHLRVTSRNVTHGLMMEWAMHLSRVPAGVARLPLLQRHDSTVLLLVVAPPPAATSASAPASPATSTCLCITAVCLAPVDQPTHYHALHYACHCRRWHGGCWKCSFGPLASTCSVP